MNNLGVYNGKMRDIIYYIFTHYNDIDEDYVTNEINAVISNIDYYTEYTFANGLSGIGASISFFAYYNIIEGDINDILSEIDSKFFNLIYFYPFDDFTHDSGLSGIGSYFFNRLNNYNKNEIEWMRIRMILLCIQDIIFAVLKLDGYYYPVGKNLVLTKQELFDIRLFLIEMLNVRISPHLTSKALRILEKESFIYDEISPFSKLRECFLSNNSEGLLLKNILEFSLFEDVYIQSQVNETAKDANLINLWKIYK